MSGVQAKVAKSAADQLALQQVCIGIYLCVYEQSDWFQKTAEMRATSMKAREAKQQLTAHKRQQVPLRGCCCKCVRAVERSGGAS